MFDALSSTTFWLGPKIQLLVLLFVVEILVVPVVFGIVFSGLMGIVRLAEVLIGGLRRGFGWRTSPS